MAPGIGVDGGEKLQIRLWESLESCDQNFTRAVWTCEGPAQILFTFDREECHYIHEGSARVGIVSSSGSTMVDVEEFIEVNAGDCFITPARARVCWHILSPIKKQTSCREPFRMVSQGWILAPPLSSSYFTAPLGEPNERTLRRTSLLGEALQNSPHSATALIDTLQEGLTQSGLQNKIS